MSATLPRAHLLFVELPGVVTWRRPRMQRGRMAYPERYVSERDAWTMVVRATVNDPEEPWQTPSANETLSVAVTVSAPGTWDLDRVVTAVLDALQNGGAIRNDCLVRELKATRLDYTRGAEARTTAAVEWRKR